LCLILRADSATPFLKLNFIIPRHHPPVPVFSAGVKGDGIDDGDHQAMHRPAVPNRGST
jgi:hypothetical protein